MLSNDFVQFWRIFNRNKVSSYGDRDWVQLLRYRINFINFFIKTNVLEIFCNPNFDQIKFDLFAIKIELARSVYAQTENQARIRSIFRENSRYFIFIIFMLKPNKQHFSLIFGQIQFPQIFNQIYYFLILCPNSNITDFWSKPMFTGFGLKSVWEDFCWKLNLIHIKP